MRRAFTVRTESFPIRGEFRISRGAKTAAEVVVVELQEGMARGWGECVPYRRYGECVAGVVAALEDLRTEVERGLSREDLQRRLPAGAARNALDCALWDLEAKQTGRSIWELTGTTPGPLTTAYTLSLDAPEAMAQAARTVAHLPLLKLKLTGAGDLERLHAVRAASPRARLMVDANEAWTLEQLVDLAPALAELGVELVEQPLPAGADGALAGLRLPVPLCADESCHDAATVRALKERYQLVNIKLDKTGGLTEALQVRAAAHREGLGVMVGCMVSTSLSMAPAAVVAQGAAVVDLDGPLLLARDRVPGLTYGGALLEPPPRALWG